MARTKKEVNEAPKAKTEADEALKFSKKQFVESRRFAKRKDLVNALLDESKTYSIDEVETLIKNFLNGKK